VLDDNKMLCLANGERIKLPSTITMVFEVEDLAVASPATVSRCGMVYLETVHLGWSPLVETWSHSFAAVLPQLSEVVCASIIKNVGTALGWLREFGRQMVNAMESQLVTGCLNLVYSLLTPYAKKPEFIEMEQKAQEDLAGMIILFAITWSIGANIADNIRSKYVAFSLERLVPELAPKFPPNASVYDYFVEGTSFISWASVMADYKYDPKMPFFNILVPTEDTTKLTYVLSSLLQVGKNVLLMGDTGVGKTVLVQDFLRNPKALEAYVPIFVMFSAQTSSKPPGRDGEQAGEEEEDAAGCAGRQEVRHCG